MALVLAGFVPTLGAVFGQRAFIVSVGQGETSKAEAKGNNIEVGHFSVSNMLQRRPVIISSVVLFIACVTILAVALVRRHEATFVAMLLAAALACWVYTLVMISQGARIRDHQIKVVTGGMPGSSANILARVFGFRDYPALAKFQYLIAPWFAGAGVVVGVGFAVVVAMTK